MKSKRKPESNQADSRLHRRASNAGRGFMTLDASGLSMTLTVPLSPEVVEHMTAVSELAHGAPSLRRVLQRLVLEITDTLSQEIEAVSCRMMKSACVDAMRRRRPL